MCLMVHRWWFDLNTPACITNVQSVMKKRLELAKVCGSVLNVMVQGAVYRQLILLYHRQSKGCDAVEPDNTDSYTNSPGFKTTSACDFHSIPSYFHFLSNNFKHTFN